MKYCKKCGVLYSGTLECCPKCNDKLSEPSDEMGRVADKKEIRRAWIGIFIGVPALILFLYLIGFSMQRLGAL